MGEKRRHALLLLWVRGVDDRSFYILKPLPKLPTQQKILLHGITVIIIINQSLCTVYDICTEASFRHGIKHKKM